MGTAARRRRLEFRVRRSMMVMGARRILVAGGTIALLALLSIPGFAAEARSEAELFALSGVTTPESDALDKEADKLVEESLKAKADAAAAFKAAAAKVDAKKMAEALKRGDKSVLFQQSPEEQHARELLDHADQLAKQAYAKAADAAAKRAHAAAEQRCLAPTASATSSPASGDRVASPYLCPGVRAGGSPTGPNDPWELCTCTRRYLLGVQKEYEELQARVKALVGQHAYVGLGANAGVITADMVEQAFVRPYMLPDVSSVAMRFEEDARGIQKDIAAGRIRKALGAGNFVISDFDTFNLSRGAAYSTLRIAGAFWGLYKTENRLWRVNILEQATEGRTKAQRDRWDALDEATLARHPEYRSADDASGFIADMRPLALQNDQRDYDYVEETAKTLRGLTSGLYDTMERFDHDMRNWANYAAKDGQNQTWPIAPPEEIRFEIGATRADPVHCCLRTITRNGELYDDPETHVWAHFPQSLLQAFPELTLSGEGAKSPPAVFRYGFAGKGREVVGIASGAADTQRP